MVVSSSSASTSTPSKARSARRRVGSSESSAVTVARSRGTTYHRSSSPIETGTTTTSASAPHSTGPVEPVSRIEPLAQLSPARAGPSATDPIVRPAASSCSSFVEPPPALITALAHTVGRNGPGAIARPSSSMTIASSA